MSSNHVKVKVLGVQDYYREVARLSDKSLWSLTDTFYPRFLARGVYVSNKSTILVCMIGNWRKTLLHELGHAIGRGHTMEVGNIMHPWGVCRGYTGASEMVHHAHKFFPTLVVDVSESSVLAFDAIGEMSLCGLSSFIKHTLESCFK